VKTLAGPAAALLGHRLALAQFVEMDLSEQLFITTARDDIDWNGHTYIGGRQTAIDAIKDQGGEIAGLSFQISGVPTDLLALALAEPIQGKAIRVYTVIMDPDSQAIVDVQQSWAGTLDQMPISQGVASSIITVTAEHRGITFARPKGLLYTDGDQQAQYPGDLCLEFIVAQSTHQDVWPAAAFFKQ